jgi:hypothetical protein
MIQLSRAGLVADREDVVELRRQFARSHWVRLPSLLDPELLSLALSNIEQGRWHERVVAKSSYYSESILERGAAFQLLMFATNAPKFLETVSEITGYNSITWFEGRVYRMAPNAGHTNVWHTDAVDGRLTAMSLNLSPCKFSGGLVQIREKESPRMLWEIANTGLGDAILFRVSRDLQHRVTDVQAGAPRTSFAGWFGTKPGLRERLRVNSLSKDKVT